MNEQRLKRRGSGKGWKKMMEGIRGKREETAGE